VNVLGIDIGSSSAKVAVLRNSSSPRHIIRETFSTTAQGSHVEVNAEHVLQAIVKAIKRIGAQAKQVDVIALDVMAPSFVVMDRAGKALSPIVTHQDRRSIDEAREIERRIGKARHLKLAGNRPAPGGISSTTFAWFARHQPDILKRADLIGHLQTLLHRHITGARVIDPSVASFSGVYSTLTLTGWNDELCDAIKLPRSLLPEIHWGDEVVGTVTREAARRFGLQQGTPMLTGVIDGSCGMLLAGGTPGRVMNVCGSTDVLTVCTDRPIPSEHLLTRALGVGRLWVHVANIPAAGSALLWAKAVLFSESSDKTFYRLVARLARSPIRSSIRFDPSLAGSRVSIEQPQGAFTGLTLSSTRDAMLSAVLESLARESAARLALFKKSNLSLKRECLVTGGLTGAVDDLLHRDWPGKWKFRHEKEATLRGLRILADGRERI